MRILARLAALVAFVVVTSGCVNGKLSPAVAPIVATLDTVACDMIAVLSGSTVAGTACADVADVVQGVLTTLPALTAPPVVAPAGAAMVAPRYRPIMAAGSVTPDVYLRVEYSDDARAKIAAAVASKRAAMKAAK